MTRSSLLAIVWVFAGLGLGCQTSLPSSPPGDASEGAREPAPAIAELVVAPESAQVSLAPGEIVLDQRADGARLVGRLQPVPVDADPERAVVLRVLRDGASIANEIDVAIDGARVLDARFAGDVVVTLGVDHTLRVHRADGATELDAHAYGPISIAGTSVAYVRGEAPLLELARANVASGVVTVLTHDMAPTWSPTLTLDGRSIVFVSGAQGSPRLYRVDGEGVPRALPELGRTPGSPIGPRFEGELFVFDDELGTAWVDLDQGRIVRSTEVAR